MLMPLRTPKDYLKSLGDGRALYLNGQIVRDVAEDSILGVGARHAALDYELAEDPRISSLYHIPRNSEDLLARFRLIEFGTRKGNGIVLFVKEIGSDILFTLLQCCQLTCSGARSRLQYAREFV